MKSYFAYIRVSTVKQAEENTSLKEQRSAIMAFARRNGLAINEWVEERETAAKQGRTAFNRMLADLERGRAAGVIIHKIDRSARNLKDWARLVDLMDRGIEVHFVRDNLDLATRGGRLSADIQAIVAADFIRNLREEVRKGIYGRLKQGLYPLPAPRGYTNCGEGMPKELDPVEAPLVRQAFELYATGNYGLHDLRLEMAKRGLRSRTGKPLTLDSISRLLHNPFYIGLIRIKRTGETFEGVHKPLVSKRVFDRVQDILAGRLYPRFQTHRFLFRRLIKCETCGRSLTGEVQKGHVYYRCHDYGCRGVSIGEKRLDALVRGELAQLKVDDGDIGDFRAIIADEIAKEDMEAGRRREQAQRDLALIDQRIERLTDAVLDGTIDKETFNQRKAKLIAQRLELRGREAESSTFLQSIAERFELGLMALQRYEIGNDDEKRDILKIVSSNLVARQNQPVFPMLSPFADVREWSILRHGAPHRGAARTRSRDRRRKLIRHFVTSLAQKARETQTAENESTIQAPARRPNSRPLLPRPKFRGARARARAARRPCPRFDNSPTARDAVSGSKWSATSVSRSPFTPESLTVPIRSDPMHDSMPPMLLGYRNDVVGTAPQVSRCYAPKPVVAPHLTPLQGIHAFVSSEHAGTGYARHEERSDAAGCSD